MIVVNCEITIKFLISLLLERNNKNIFEMHCCDNLSSRKSKDCLDDFKMSYANQVNLGGQSQNPRESLYKINSYLHTNKDIILFQTFHYFLSSLFAF